MEGACSCNIGGQYNGGRMVMSQKWSFEWRENGQKLQKSPVNWRENSRYRGGQFKRGRMVMLQMSV